jgi:methylenetetrahydrofolate reductase (NADPH)
MSAITLKAGSNLEKILSADAFAVTAECGPPRNADAGVIREKVRFLRGSVDAVNVTDTRRPWCDLLAHGSHLAAAWVRPSCG